MNCMRSVQTEIIKLLQVIECNEYKKNYFESEITKNL